jgi:hypothetical protein
MAAQNPELRELSLKLSRNLSADAALERALQSRKSVAKHGTDDFRRRWNGIWLTS